ncbi:MAG TPA: alkaline phosphatase PhoX [Nocardioidaceae bacterium]|nr:alkaline phosphatase PhoX [Nocardioidaceae bacterium]
MSMQRRTVLKGGAAAAGAAIAGGPFQGLTVPATAGRGRAPFRALRPIPDLRDGKIRLHLPAGFSYRSFHDTEVPVTLDDGTELPGRHDGMGAFRGSNGNVVLVRNHELNNPGEPFGPGDPYDAMGQGGCTHIEVTPFGEVVHAYTALNGTMMNCSGGIMPWGSWVTCEETVNGPDVGPDFTGASNVPLQKPHGFIFEVPSNADSDRQPITRAGRFAHEAVSFDPVEGCLYLTEDNFGFPSGFYRYKPKNNPMLTGRLDNEGTLQMLAVRGEPNAHLEAGQRRRATYKARWVDIDDPDPVFPYTPSEEAPTSNDEALVYVGDQGRAQGAAHFSRLEGQVYDDGVVYFCSTQGGGPAEDGPDASGGYGNGHGQVWAYHTRSQILQLIYEAPVDDTRADRILDLPDNCTTSARGTLVLCEDSDVNNYLRGLSRGGQIWDIALNRVTSGITDEDRFSDEFAGSTFSSDGHTLFVNIQASAGMTFAIWGPWRRIGV